MIMDKCKQCDKEIKAKGRRVELRVVTIDRSEAVRLKPFNSSSIDLELCEECYRGTGFITCLSQAARVIKE